MNASICEKSARGMVEWASITHLVYDETQKRNETRDIEDPHSFANKPSLQGWKAEIMELNVITLVAEAGFGFFMSPCI